MQGLRKRAPSRAERGNVSKWNTELLRRASLVGTDAKDPEQNLMAYIREAIDRVEQTVQESSQSSDETFKRGIDLGARLVANHLRAELGLDND